MVFRATQHFCYPPGRNGQCYAECDNWRDRYCLSMMGSRWIPAGIFMYQVTDSRNPAYRKRHCLSIWQQRWRTSQHQNRRARHRTQRAPWYSSQLGRLYFCNEQHRRTIRLSRLRQSPNSCLGSVTVFVPGCNGNVVPWSQSAARTPDCFNRKASRSIQKTTSM